MTIHELKCWPEQFEDIVVGAKTFDLRKHDRNFKVGDALHLRQWNQHNQGYTSPVMECLVEVTYLMTEGFGLPEGYCIMGIARLSTWQAPV